ncbi:MAG: hypothetical protein PHR77_18835 [Kiritimatiellae bacterium]|nr:hypothetical protein [Kiritimatiellia bacterium]MDD5519771.1 hypothetical protein [Kiritimatiellia bacterium]
MPAALTGIILLLATVISSFAQGKPIDLQAIESPIIFKGNETTAYRDPAAIYTEGIFHLYFTLVRKESDGNIYSYTAWSKSSDLKDWTEPNIFTVRDRNRNFCSPGDIVRYNNEWLICLCTYPRPRGEKYGNETARIWIMRSKDLENWSEPELLRVKGPNVPVDKMGRMIDAYLFKDKDVPGKWWCFYKQNGMSMSWSTDFKNWNFFDSTHAGENVCILVDKNEYVLFHSPQNGIGVKRSRDLKTWVDDGLITLGQKGWPWAKGRITAGFVLDLRQETHVGKYLMFFHGSGPEDEQTMFDNHASIGLAWSDDLKTWHWPGEKQK